MWKDFKAVNVSKCTWIKVLHSCCNFFGMMPFIILYFPCLLCVCSHSFSFPSFLLSPGHMHIKIFLFFLILNLCFKCYDEGIPLWIKIVLKSNPHSTQFIFYEEIFYFWSTSCMFAMTMVDSIFMIWSVDRILLILW